jgi:hypothetical protein
MNALYKDIDISVPQNKSMGWNVGALPIFRTGVIRSIKRLTIRNGYMDRRDPIYHRKGLFDDGSLEAYVEDITNRTPLNQLQAFS